MDSSVGYTAAVLAGLASFASPCVVPLVPTYLAVIAGLGARDNMASGESVSTSPSRLAAVGNTLMFIAGFTAVFVALGMTATTLGSGLGRHQAVLTRASGVVMVGFALYLVGTMVLHRPSFYGEYRFHPRLAKLGRAGAPVAGAAFAFGWTPCVGPILGSILVIASQQHEAWRGGVLLLLYSAGLGLPLLAGAIALERIRGVLNWFRSHATLVTIVSAVALGAIGVLLVLDRLAWITTQTQHIL